MISRSTVTPFSLTISGSVVAECVWQFHALAMNLFFLSIWCVGRAVVPYVSCHSDFSCDFKVCGVYIFADDFWLVVMQFSLTIPFVNDDSVFSIDFMRQTWISIRCRFHPSAVIQFSKMISRSTETQFSLMISRWAMAECVYLIPHIITVQFIQSTVHLKVNLT
jgi:hypothetical protein